MYCCRDRALLLMQKRKAANNGHCRAQASRSWNHWTRNPLQISMCVLQQPPSLNPAGTTIAVAITVSLMSIGTLQHQSNSRRSHGRAEGLSHIMNLVQANDDRSKPFVFAYRRRRAFRYEMARYYGPCTHQSQRTTMTVPTISC